MDSPLRSILKSKCVRTIVALTTLAAITTVFATETTVKIEHADVDKRPNIVLIVVDDAGLTDFAPYGGEAAMPTIQTLADTGSKFTNYHTSPLCAPSRAMLLTGIDNHRTGIATIPEVLTEEQQGQPGYSMYFEPGVTTLAQRLKMGGYKTYMTGKWHLGGRQQDLPNAHGFDRSFALDASGADNWEQKSYIGYYPEAPWFEDGQPGTLPDDFYSSQFIIDKMIDYLDGEQNPAERQPFFSYIAFQAVHIPVQAPREFTDHYIGVYDAGWQALREKRWQRAKQLGLIPETAPLADMPEGLRDWNALSADDKQFFARAMSVHAGMLEAMDSHIGRLINFLRERDELDNTLFVITSDNGPEPSDPSAIRLNKLWMATHGYDIKIETLGEKGSMGFIGPEWASATASPNGLFKFYASEGGLRVPLIISGPAIAAGKSIIAMTTVTDIVPTILDYLNLPLTLPVTSILDAGESVPEIAITGRSLLPVLNGSQQRIYGEDEAIGIEVSGNSALFKGDYKITRNTPPYGDNIWRLYNLANDPGETLDLRLQESEKFDELLVDYENYATEFGVLPMDSDFDYIKQVIANSKIKQFTVPRQIAMTVVILLILLAVYRLRQKRRNPN